MRETWCRETCRDGTNNADAILFKIEDGYCEDPGDKGDEGPGDNRPGPPDQEDEGDGAQSDGKGPRVGEPEIPDELDELLKERSGTAGNTQNFRQLPDDDSEGNPEDEPGHHRFGEEIRDEPEPGNPRDKEDNPGQESERSRERDGHRWIPEGKRRHDRS